MIDKNKQYRTRQGEEVRIYAVDGDKDMPVHGAILTKHGWKVSSWASDGKWFPNTSADVDLIEVRPRIRREVWANVYPNGVDDELWFTKEVADQQALTSHIACVRLTIDCEEGEGLCVTDFSLPPEAVEAAAKALMKAGSYRFLELAEDDAITTLRAGIAAWPGMEARPTFEPSRIILPLLTENTDVES